MLRTATIEGAQADLHVSVQAGDEVGSLEAGEQAYLILVDMTVLNLSPVLEAQVQAEEVARRVAADPVHRGMALLETMEAGQL